MVVPWRSRRATLEFRAIKLLEIDDKSHDVYMEFMSCETQLSYVRALVYFEDQK